MRQVCVGKDFALFDRPPILCLRFITARVVGKPRTKHILRGVGGYWRDVVIGVRNKRERCVFHHARRSSEAEHLRFVFLRNKSRFHRKIRTSRGAKTTIAMVVVTPTPMARTEGLQLSTRSSWQLFSAMVGLLFRRCSSCVFVLGTMWRTL